MLLNEALNGSLNLIYSPPIEGRPIRQSISIGKNILTESYFKLKVQYLQLLKTPPLPQWFVPLRPFSVEVWIAIIIVTILSLLLGALYGAFYPLSESSGGHMVLWLTDVILGSQCSQFEKLKTKSVR